MLSLYKDREENLWIGTDGGGLNRLKRREFQTYTANDGLSHDRATSIYQSRDGSVWIGTAGGLNRLKGDTFTTYTTKDGLSGNLVRALLEDDRGNLWIGTDGAGLNLLRDGRFTAYTHKNGLSNDWYCRWLRMRAAHCGLEPSGDCVASTIHHSVQLRSLASWKTASSHPCSQAATEALGRLNRLRSPPTERSPPLPEKNVDAGVKKRIICSWSLA